MTYDWKEILSDTRYSLEDLEVIIRTAVSDSYRAGRESMVIGADFSLKEIRSDGNIIIPKSDYLRGKEDTVKLVLTILKAHHMFRTAEDDFNREIETENYKTIYERVKRLMEDKDGLEQS